MYGLLILESGVGDANRLFHLIAIVIAMSILAHASTDVVVARWFKELPPDEEALPPNAQGMSRRRSAGEACDRSVGGAPDVIAGILERTGDADDAVEAGDGE